MHTGESVGEHTRYTQHTAVGPFIPRYTQQLGPLLQAIHTDCNWAFYSHVASPH